MSHLLWFNLRIKKISLKIFILIISLLVVIITAQFILGKKQLDYGFFNDDWDNLAAYKMVVKNPFFDILDAWKTLGSHRFAHVYYIGILFDFFKFDYLSYNITNQLLKAISNFTLFPIVYLLFKKKLVAFLATFFYTVHYSPYGTLDDVSRGEDFLAIITMNLFIALYIKASQIYSFNLKTMFTLLILFASTAFFAPSRAYPIILMLPLLELFNFFLNRQSTNLKASILRVIFLYSPFIAALLFSPSTILAQVGYYKGLWEMLNLGNFQLFLAPFASFGSTFVPNNLISLLFDNQIYQQFKFFIPSVLLRILVISAFLYTAMGFLISSSPKRFLIRAFLINACFSSLAFMAANVWQHLDVKFRASVDPATFFFPALVGLFVLSASISFFIEWLATKKRDIFMIGLFLTPGLSFLYIFLTWVLTDVNSIFMGTHAYLNIPAIGVAVYLAIIIYLVYQKLYNSRLRISSIVALLLLISFILIYFKISSLAVDQYFSYYLKNGFAASDQKRLYDTFWQEIGRNKKISIENPALIYLDGFQDYENGMYYENAFVWRIPALFFVETGKTLPACDLIMYKVDIKEIKVKILNGKKVITQERCGSNLVYQIENFYAFKLVNRDIIPNRIEVLKKIGIE